MPHGWMMRKVSDTGKYSQDWRPAHIVEWEKAHGSVPKGCILIFKDGNNLNSSIENLECISRAEALNRVSYQNWPEDIAGLVRIRAALNKEITVRRRKNA